jgi:adenylosuccinate synthase
MIRPSAHIVIGLGYGDEGKGLMVDYLCRRHQARLVIRFSGGPQPTHTVQLKDGKRHSFAQFGAGTFIPDCYTYLSDYMCIEPYALLNEYQALYALGIDDALKRLYIDPFCTVITPYHWLANRLRESARAENRHGSCGMGLHECKKDRKNGYKIYANGLSHARHALAEIKGRKLSQLYVLSKTNTRCAEYYEKIRKEDTSKVADFYAEAASKFKLAERDLLKSYRENVVFEGSQGVLLDKHAGFYPYVTHSHTTFKNAEELLERMYHKTIKVGVIRTYMTKHGAGPFPTEALLGFEEKANMNGEWQGAFRQGYLDIPAIKYAIKCVSGVDELAVTHWDQNALTETQVQRLGEPIKYQSFGPTAEDVREIL